MLPSQNISSKLLQRLAKEVEGAAGRFSSVLRPKEAPQPRGATPTSGKPRPLKGRPRLPSLPVQGGERRGEPGIPCTPSPALAPGQRTAPECLPGTGGLCGSRGSDVRIFTGRVDSPDVAGYSIALTLHGDPGGGVGGRQPTSGGFAHPTLTVAVGGGEGRCLGHSCRPRESWLQSQRVGGASLGARAAGAEMQWGAEVTEGRGSRRQGISELCACAGFPLDSAKLGPGPCFPHKRGNRGRRCPRRRGQRRQLLENWGGKGEGEQFGPFLFICLFGGASGREAKSRAKEPRAGKRSSEACSLQPTPIKLLAVPDLSSLPPMKKNLPTKC